MSKTIRVRVREPVRLRTRDTLIGPVTPAESARYQEETFGPNGVDLGILWTGTFKPVLDGLPEEARAALLMKVIDYAERGGHYRRDATGATVSTGDGRSKDWLQRTNLSTRADLSEMQSGNEKFWASAR